MFRKRSILLMKYPDVKTQKAHQSIFVSRNDPDLLLQELALLATPVTRHPEFSIFSRKQMATVCFFKYFRLAPNGNYSEKKGGTDHEKGSLQPAE